MTSKLIIQPYDKKTISKTIKVIYVIATIALITGIYLEMGDVEAGNIITIAAVIIGVIALIIENIMLKMIIKQMKGENK